MNNLRIGARLGVAFGAMILLLLAILVTGILKLSALNEDTEAIITKEWAKTQSAHQLETIVRDNARRTFELMTLSDKAQAEAVLAKVAANKKVGNEAVERLDKLLYLPEGKALLEQIKPARAAYVESFGRVQRLLFESGDRTEAQRLMKAETLPRLDQLTGHIERLVALQDRLAKEAQARSEAQYRSGRSILLALGAIAVIACIVFSMYITRGIVTPLRDAVAIAAAIAKGDLTLLIGSDRRDETGELIRALAAMQDGLRGIMAQLRKTVDKLSDASTQLAGSSTEVTATLLSQSDSTASIASTVEQVSQSIASISANATHAEEVSAKLNASSGDAIVRIHDAIAGIKGVADEAHSATAVVDELNRHADNIRGIVRTIKEIAEQTNLLALNAAIEAARAGESGRGFAVVADEVRKLADRTTASTQEVAATIAMIEAGTQSAVDAMGSVAAHAMESTTHADAAEDSMLMICGGVESIYVGVRDISGAIAEQTTAMGGVAQSVASLAAATEETHAVAEQLAEVAAHLSQLEQDLKGNVAHIQV